MQGLPHSLTPNLESQAMASVSLDFSTKTHFFYGFSNLEPHRDEPLGSKFLIIYTGAFTEKQRTGSKSEWGKKAPLLSDRRGFRCSRDWTRLHYILLSAMKVYREMTSCWCWWEGVMRVGRNRNGCKIDVFGPIFILFILHACMYIILYPSLCLGLLKDIDLPGVTNMKEFSPHPLFSIILMTFL